jgi:hypothetical protein
MKVEKPSQSESNEIPDEEDENDLKEYENVHEINEPETSSTNTYTVSYMRKPTTYQSIEAVKVPSYYKENVSVHPDGYTPTKLMPRDNKYLPHEYTSKNKTNTTIAPTTVKYKTKTSKINENYENPNDYAVKKETGNYEANKEPKEIAAKKEYLESLLDTLREMVKAQKVLERPKQKRDEKKSSYSSNSTAKPSTTSKPVTYPLTTALYTSKQKVLRSEPEVYSREYNSVQAEKFVPYETSTHLQNLDSSSQIVDNMRQYVYSDENENKSLDEYGYPFTTEKIRAKIKQALLDYDQRYHMSQLKCPGCKRNRNYISHRDLNYPQRPSWSSKSYSAQNELNSSGDLRH